MKKILLLAGKNNPLFCFTKSKDYDVICEDIYKNNYSDIFVKILRNIHFVTKFCLAEWKFEQNFDLIIIFDSNVTYDVLVFIEKNYKNTRKIFYYRNQINKRIKPQRVKKMGFEVWSYHMTDCRKYNLQYNNQVINKKLFENALLRNSKLQQDIIFLGTDKKRAHVLEDLYLLFEKMNIRSYFYVVDNNTLSFNQCKNGQYLPYNKYLKILSTSKAVLDLVNEANNGLTFRPIEALFAEKKLVTNYQEIVKYDFYNSNNIFVLGIDKIELLKEFLKTPYQKLDYSILERYDIDGWLQHFLKIEENSKNICYQ